MSLPRHRLSNRQREELYDLCRGERERPSCNICGLEIWPGQEWDVSHEPHLPHALGGTEVAVAHRRCNRLHNNLIATPQVAKAKRIRQKFIGAFRTNSPMRGGRDDSIKKKMNGEVVLRSTGQRWRKA